MDSACSTLESTLNKPGKLVLLYSSSGKNRPAVVIIGTLMRRFNWTLSKSHHFYYSKIKGFYLKTSYRQILVEYEKTLKEKGIKLLDGWEKRKEMSTEEILLTNTYLNCNNSKMLKYMIEKKLGEKKKKRKTRGSKSVNWADDLVSTIPRHVLQTKKSNNFILKKVPAIPSFRKLFTSHTEQVKCNPEFPNSVRLSLNRTRPTKLRIIGKGSNTLHSQEVLTKAESISTIRHSNSERRLKPKIKLRRNNLRGLTINEQTRKLGRYFSNFKL